MRGAINLFTIAYAVTISSGNDFKLDVQYQAITITPTKITNITPSQRPEISYEKVVYYEENFVYTSDENADLTFYCKTMITSKRTENKHPGYSFTNSVTINS